jgi:hypothetical protein
MKYSILLNFLPFKEQNFKYDIYRKECKGEKKEYVGENLYLNTLPISFNDLEVRKNYWISFIKKDDFDKFICVPNYNNKLTIHYLYYCLIEKVKDKINDRVIVPENLFRKIIYLVLREYQEGQECLLLFPYYLSSENKFGFIVDFKFRKKEEVPFNKRIQQLSLSLDKYYRSNSNFYIDKYEKLNIFLGQFYSQIFPLRIGDKFMELDNKFLKIPSNTLKTKTYLVSNSNETKSQFIGIREYGPYKKLSKKITLSFFYRIEDKLFASDLAKAIRGDVYSTFSGIKNFFQIPSIEIEGFAIQNDNFEDRIIKVSGEKQEGKNCFIPIILISKNEKEKYYSIKFSMLKNYKQPVQFATLELLKDKNSLKWSVASIALQIFAKLNGIPWIVKAETNKALIIGIGQAHKIIMQDDKYKIEKYFSYSVLTDSSGLYKELKTLGKSDKSEDYLSQISKSLKKIIKEYKEEFEYFVIHVPFKIKRFELEKIKETINLYGEDKIFVVIKINTENKFFGFNSKSNSLVPYESTYVKLNTKEFLIWFEGLQYHNPNVNKKKAGPTHIEFYYSNRRLEDEEKISLLQDIINLAGANWRGFNAKSTPISIHYAQLVSRFIKNFEGFDNINIENIKPWFL